MNYKTIVGLEIHVELSTKTKAFCSCENAYGKDPNTLTCPVCLGLPGGLPVLNEEVVKYTVMAGHAFNCDIKNHSKFDRKNYFYPDLRKGFQITQDDMAICYDGYIEIKDDDGNDKKIGLMKIQMEEDTGKSMHMENNTYMDYNRCGVPLIEIVTKPDISSGREAREFLEKLKSTLVYLDISDCKMEEGSLRCDVNVNVVDLETGKKTSVTEVKNLNSFRGVERAIDFEVERHINMLKNDDKELKTTRRWDDEKNETVLMRIKYTAADYRFAPEGDLPPVFISDEYIREVKENMPELPEEKQNRFIKSYSLPEYDAKVLTSTRELADYYEKLVSDFSDYQMASNWMMTEVLRRVDMTGDNIFETPFEVEDLRILLNEIKTSKINNNAGKKVLRKMFEENKKPKDIIEELGLSQISDDSFIEEIVKSVLEKNPQSIEDIKAGKNRAFGFLVGQVMKESKGKANPQIVNKLLEEKLNNM